MKYANIHKWDLSPKEAVRAQLNIVKHIKLSPLPVSRVKTVAGVDVSVKNDISRAAVVILSFPEMSILETVTHTEKTCFPYIPGLLSFREAPVILKCVDKLRKIPDVFIFDGQGLAHPRGCGLACHMGVILDRPAIGSAKTHLYGTYKMPLKKKGNFSYIASSDKNKIGAVLITRDDTNPVYVSPGHKTDIASSIKIISMSSHKYKIPEPIRAAHNAAKLP